ncbi:MAG TPA: formate dehydrogenase accessory sulfurtransferase FdhD [Chitinophagaceae bacterium]|nr:formate dehydrogenase accessory sulfurtransferase FdhD [Chitinophagaceae bacterium]
MENTFTTPTRVRKITNDDVADVDDQLVVEEPLEIHLQFGTAENRVQKSISVTMRTPGHDIELTAGFLFTEGIIRSGNDILFIEQDSADGNRILFALQDNVDPGLQKTERNFYTTSSCGVCGKSSIEAIKAVSVYGNQEQNILLKTEVFYALQDNLKSRQAIFESTGGIHASALFDREGNFIMLREDVGRHNALDKLIGASLLNDELPLTNTVLLLSGRASFELIQKASMAGIKVVAAVGAPSSLAVELAKECKITLVGFLRNERFNIYSCEERIVL